MRITVLFILTSLTIMASACKTAPEETIYPSYDDYPVYEGSDLGVRYTPETTTFRLWSPTAEEAKLRFYNQALGGEASRETNMEKA
ncbi:MAG: hypothetical protein KDD10_22390, partial [Phaeodactylibacter sp.]|nr:hypothetical protein [Phaeodactylibacter sp.]